MGVIDMLKYKRPLSFLIAVALVVLAARETAALVVLARQQAYLVQTSALHPPQTVL